VQHRPTIEHDDFTDLEIPTVDLSSLDSEDEDERKQVVADVRTACLDWGIFHAVNHGIPLELLDRVQKQAQKFFDLAKEEKLKVSKAPGSLAGYGHAAVKPTDSQPWSEGFYLANDGSTESFERTLWPKGDNKEFV
jgi:leucoanthocyanidin dioxygenase